MRHMLTTVVTIVATSATVANAGKADTPRASDTSTRGRAGLRECAVLDCTSLSDNQINEKLLEVSMKKEVLVLTGVDRFWRHEHWANVPTLDIMTQGPERWKYPVESHDQSLDGDASATRGAHMHNHEQTFLALRAGAKRWYFAEDPPRTSDRRVSEDDLVRMEKIACTTVQYANEVIFVPHWAWHATYNGEEATVGVSSFDTSSDPSPEIPVLEWLKGGGPYQIELAELLKPDVNSRYNQRLESLHNVDGDL
mmetsp:Transcript_32328/g.84619  ORF Transcript_32328/g.84619 Transcript_32328/m.84619 type:complete len:253 (-) Transcript_32328:282-1040(-)|eukprot:CAMPEP_0182938274 /NCGR_PEP_ID=MMETSP0105_2-20130417/43571_1 /TAXON_ID=81532 ORGANISM="Acanthoeca-like sp., Strain 10tr" /NCGR_SAMPLE_ID=MMETSP0105_2 /ASSEMBLY_ACC=CAM_ASM_000205 /LENGTH=252 /DNA_ID=CAMNT_0025077561 /DNA_START=270 /DNA_END=1028 /DNA_ORIENTATION=+